MVATGAHMAIFTGRELALLSNLRSDWQNLYQQELARLQRNEDALLNPNNLTANRRGIFYA
jgi:hypothetical protein